MQLVGGQVPTARFAVACFNEDHARIAAQQAEGLAIRPEIFAGKTPELIRAAKCCLACSGSVSLELLSHLKPSVIHYGISPFGNVLQGFVVKSRYITLVNLLATERIERAGGGKFDPDAAGAEDVPFPEYLTVGDKSAAMAKHLVRWLTDEAEYARRVDQLRRLRDQWGRPGASQAAAGYVLQTLENSSLRQSAAA
jgi:lipid-A-disaccharide synthase